MSITIKPCTVEVLQTAPSLAALLDEYAAECSLGGLPKPAPDFGLYKRLEEAGALYTLGAYDNDTLVGFASVLTHVLPHYGVAVSVTESFFVAASHRRTGAGLKLLRLAEEHAKERGAAGLLVSTPTGSTLALVMSGMEYKETNRVFFKGFAHD